MPGCLYTECLALNVLLTNRRELGEHPFPPHLYLYVEDGLILAFDDSYSGSGALLYLNHRHICVALSPRVSLILKH